MNESYANDPSMPEDSIDVLKGNELDESQIEFDDTCQELNSMTQQRKLIDSQMQQLNQMILSSRRDPLLMSQNTTERLSYREPPPMAPKVQQPDHKQKRK